MIEKIRTLMLFIAINNAIELKSDEFFNFFFKYRCL